ncbi:MAG: DnaJ domain-containing protein [Chitinophagales bacterium]|nr:DnaJ domain-containing protein [Chitinophagales bacterium]
MQYIKKGAGAKKPDLRIGYMMLAAYVVQLSEILSVISFYELKKRLTSFFDAGYTEQRFAFFNELLRQRIQVDAICAQMNTYATPEEKLNLLKFLIALSANGKSEIDRSRSLYYVSSKLGIDDNTFKSFYKAQQYTPPKKEKTVYEILQVNVSVTYAELRKAYHKLAKQYHPDAHADPQQNKKALNEKFREITEAYEKIKVMRGWK